MQLATYGNETECIAEPVLAFTRDATRRPILRRPCAPSETSIIRITATVVWFVGVRCTYNERYIARQPFPAIIAWIMAHVYVQRTTAPASAASVLRPIYHVSIILPIPVESAASRLSPQ